MYSMLDIKRRYVSETKHKESFKFCMRDQCDFALARRANGSFRLALTSWANYAVNLFVGGAMIHVYIIQHWEWYDVLQD